jgi:hypothetical protein
MRLPRNFHLFLSIPSNGQYGCGYFCSTSVLTYHRWNHNPIHYSSTNPSKNSSQYKRWCKKHLPASYPGDKGFSLLDVELIAIEVNGKLASAMFFDFRYACARKVYPPVQYMLQMWSKYDSNRLREKVRRVSKPSFTNARSIDQSIFGSSK